MLLIYNWFKKCICSNTFNYFASCILLHNVLLHYLVWFYIHKVILNSKMLSSKIAKCSGAQLVLVSVKLEFIVSATAIKESNNVKSLIIW